MCGVITDRKLWSETTVGVTPKLASTGVTESVGLVAHEVMKWLSGQEVPATAAGIPVPTTDTPNHVLRMTDRTVPNDLGRIFIMDHIQVVRE
jgi:hypothetical protein